MAPGRKPPPMTSTSTHAPVTTITVVDLVSGSTHDIPSTTLVVSLSQQEALAALPQRSGGTRDGGGTLSDDEVADQRRQGYELPLADLDAGSYCAVRDEDSGAWWVSQVQPAPLTVSIQDGPLTPDFDGRNRGWRACLLLDPEDRTVSVFACIGSGTPEPVWHRRALTVSVNQAASGEHVAALVEANAALVQQIFDRYEGSHWDGNNTVGTWDEGDDGDLDALVQHLEAALEQAPTYWAAGDWLSGDWGGCRREVAQALADGRDLDQLAAEWVAGGARDGALLTRRDVRAQIDQMVEEVREQA